MSTFYDCSGCGLCALVCPTWTQNRAIDLLPWGRAKAVQGGASSAEIQDSLEACVHCGACEPICPEKIKVGTEDIKHHAVLGTPINKSHTEDQNIKTKKQMLKSLVKHLGKGDFYWIDAPSFHKDYEKLVRIYDKFRKESNCELNWNLQRTAMPLGYDNSFFDRKKQYDWVVFNKSIKRIVVENKNDWQWLKENSEYPVVHVSELIGNL